MVVVCEALIHHHQAGKPIRVKNIFHRTGWRFMLYIRGIHQFVIAITRISPFYFVWRIIWGVSSFVRHQDFDIKDFYDNSPFRNTISSIQVEFDREIILFIDNGERVLVPCSSTAEDKDILEHLRIFYNLTHSSGGIFELFGAKSSQRIDIVELQDSTVGDCVGPPLGLGRHGTYSRQIHYFRDPSSLKGLAITNRLIAENVLTAVGQHTHALNIVRSWDPYVTSLMVLLPVALSLGASITWSAIAKLYFNVDAQASTQTGFTIGSYIITAGTLLIALVAFLDTKVKSGER
ncbi:predicted protein [Pyrenophora tritici-repentis Pt-1C-BFP]|uniref:Uncharacterized protein n=1 Tax=Pyrenophora tritici-repentis (strain Pt-1C-BFP) TaxID=426418 RepID=B2WL87_PYRTR|nr:uncharacterized protein PTRG_10747 [Pyrenophora tritici-repentis Pt-1C-BFP]EDU43797.1 predicted protein [Pyrenophora tritici-repentis Pt-1C-BFP]